MFENFYLLRVIAVKAKPSFVFTAPSLAIALLAVGIPKLAQEYLMHVRFVDQVWFFLRDHFFWWLYQS